MERQKYSVNQHLIETILTWVKSGEIAIPEIQRPFVWDSTQVRDLLDSLYKGFPVGYIIAWKNPNIRLKDGSYSEGKKVLIDGQQRVTALTASLLDQYIVDKEYRRVKIKIAFHPIEERFEVLNPAIRKDVAWIQDIAPIISGEERTSRVVRDYCDRNNNTREETVEDSLEKLKHITKKQIGLIELEPDLDIDTVTEIFIRINSKGVVLSQADFAMSKIAANQSYGGWLLRKGIDYFCHLAVAPEFHSQLSDADKEFTESEYYPKISWLKTESDDLYDPEYSDLLRVAFTSEFGRGKLSDLVSLLSGRNFETKTFEESIAQASFEQLKQGVLNFINESNFKRFLMIIKSAGFVDSSLISSRGALNFAYIVYLSLRKKRQDAAQIESFVRRWFVMSLLTGRYSGSPESMFDFDIRNIIAKEFDAYLKDIEAGELSDSFWRVALVQQLETSSVNNPAFNTYLASLCKLEIRGLFSRDISVREMIEHKGDIHHIFPKHYLKKHGFSRSQYNQVANFTYMQTEINVKIGNKAPSEYFSEVLDNAKKGKAKYGSINERDALMQNLKQNDIPEDIFKMDVDHYHEFLAKRRALMAEKIREYYQKL